MRRILLFTLLVALVACESEEQALPFTLDDSQLVTRTIPVSGGIISSPAGAAIHFPSGSLRSEAALSLEPFAPPASLQISGRAIARAFALSLAQPDLFVGEARADLRYDRTAAGDSAWLASLVRLGMGVREEIAATRVDLTTAIATATIRSAGTLGLVIPESSALVPLQQTAAPLPETKPASYELALRYADVDSLTIICGSVGDRCSGMRVSASPNLLERIARGALVYPRIHTVLRLSDGLISGMLSLDAVLRAELQSRSIAESVGIEESRGVQARIFPPGSTSAPLPPGTPLPPAEDAVIDVGNGVLVHLPGTGTDPTLIFAHTFQIPNGEGGFEPASLRITVPFQIHR